VIEYLLSAGAYLQYPGVEVKNMAWHGTSICGHAVPREARRRYQRLFAPRRRVGRNDQPRQTQNPKAVSVSRRSAQFQTTAPMFHEIVTLGNFPSLQCADRSVKIRKRSKVAVE
jgi:hypothetical protein